MTALHLDLNPELGPDHYFHVVPGVSESSLAAKGGYLHRRGGCRAHVARFVIAPASRRRSLTARRTHSAY